MREIFVTHSYHTQSHITITFSCSLDVPFERIHISRTFWKILYIHKHIQMLIRISLSPMQLTKKRRKNNEEYIGKCAYRLAIYTYNDDNTQDSFYNTQFSKRGKKSIFCCCCCSQNSLAGDSLGMLRAGWNGIPPCFCGACAILPEKLCSYIYIRTEKFGDTNGWIQNVFLLEKASIILLMLLFFACALFSSSASAKTQPLRVKICCIFASFSHILSLSLLFLFFWEMKLIPIEMMNKKKSIRISISSNGSSSSSSFCFLYTHFQNVRMVLCGWWGVRS